MRGFFCQYSRAMPPSPIQAEKLRPVAATLPPLRTARQRYQEGAIDFLNVITTQAQVLQSENDLADSDTQIATCSSISIAPSVGDGRSWMSSMVRMTRRGRRLERDSAPPSGTSDNYHTGLYGGTRSRRPRGAELEIRPYADRRKIRM